LREINTFGKLHRIQVFYFWTDESRGGYPGFSVSGRGSEIDYLP